MSGRPNKRRVAADLDQARLHAEKGEWSAVEGVTRALFDAGADEPLAEALRGEALRQLSRRDEARRVLDEALARHPKDPELELRLGCVLLDQDDPTRAIELLERARAKRPRDPQVLTSCAAALLRAGRFDEAERLLARAMLVGGGPDTKLVLALVKLRRGAMDEADRLAAQVEATVGAPALEWAARGLRADITLMRGEAAPAFEAWKRLEAAGFLEPHQLAHMAYAAQLVGEVATADRLIEQRLREGVQEDDLLLFAQIANLRGDAARALEWLGRLKSPGEGFEFAAARGRALRLAGGRVAEARRILEAALQQPEAAIPHFGAAVSVDLGHLAAEEGLFEDAEAHFRHALSLDAGDPEAQRGLKLASRRLAWRAALEASAEDRVDAARAETESLRRRFVARESEVDRLKRELERLKSERADVEASARKALAEADAAKKKIDAERQQRLRDELAARERDIEQKADENLERAFGASRAKCPPQLFQLVLVAERTFQKALYTELPAAAVAVLYSGAFERSLVELLVRPFDLALDAAGARQAFLDGGVRERRGGRVEYLDRFFETLDRELSARPPSLGEMSRVLERRHDRHLAAFNDFLGRTFALDEPFWDEFARFVTWAKETLRDPVAHGHLELDWEGLKQFRERLLFAFAGQPTGALPRLLAARSP